MSRRFLFIFFLCFLLVSCADRSPAPVVHYGQKSGPGSVGVHTIDRGDTLNSIAQRYRLPVRDIAFLNNLKAPYRIEVGQRLQLPPPREYIVQRGDSINSIAQLFGVSGNEVVSLNQIQSPYVLRIGQLLRLPSTLPEKSVVAPPKHKSKSVAKQTPVEREILHAPVKDDAYPSIKPKPVRKQIAARMDDGVPVPGTKPHQPTRITKVTTAAPKRSSSRFLKPVRGQIISGFGAKKSGLHNDGINISASRGSSVKAAENGVVVYAGDALKGSGNLILIRHANQWMTAYAHLDKIDIRKGEVLKRGDVIGKVGSTGAVSKPQLHFEIRKGTTAVNPVKYLD